MSTVLISFIGTGRPDAGGTGGRYQPTSYRFRNPDGSEHLEKTSLFGAALLRWLRMTGQAPGRWLVLGTEQSIWGDLLFGFQEDPGQMIDDYFRIDDAVREGCLTPELLHEWSKRLSPHAEGTALRFRLVDGCRDRAAQEQLLRTFLDEIQKGDEVILDITHGYRHLPVLAAFVLFYLRWVRDIQVGGLYYGAFEMRGMDGPAPVVEAGFCSDLFHYSEALATHAHTGSYQPIADALKLEPAIAGPVSQISFRDEINQTVRNRANEAVRALDAGSGGDTSAETLLAELRRELEQVGEANLSQRLLRKAQFAFNHRQYFRAVALLQEGTLVTLCQLQGKGDGLGFKEREAAWDAFIKGGWNEQRLSRQEYQSLWALRYLRNAILHGTSPDTHHENPLARASARDAQAALDGEKAFRALYLTAQRVAFSLAGLD